MRLLYAEDERDLNEVVTRTLLKNHYSVDSCFDGEEAALKVPFVTYGRRDNAADQAQHLFDTLRELDDRGAKRVYAACPSEDGVGLAVYNRLLRAAGFEVIDLD